MTPSGVLSIVLRSSRSPRRGTCGPGVVVRDVQGRPQVLIRRKPFRLLGAAADTARRNTRSPSAASPESFSTRRGAAGRYRGHATSRYSGAVHGADHGRCRYPRPGRPSSRRAARPRTVLGRRANRAIGRVRHEELRNRRPAGRIRAPGIRTSPVCHGRWPWGHCRAARRSHVTSSPAVSAVDAAGNGFWNPARTDLCAWGLHGLEEVGIEPSCRLADAGHPCAEPRERRMDGQPVQTDNRGVGAGATPVPYPCRRDGTDHGQRGDRGSQPESPSPL